MAKLKVMVFDQDQLTLDLCGSILIRNNFEFYSSTSSENLLEKVNNVHPDIILVDHLIPLFGGLHALKVLKSEPVFNNIRTILFASDSNIKELSISAGADAYLLKPFSMKDLVGIMVP